MISVVSSSSYFIDTTFSDNIAIAGKSFYFAYAILSINGCNFARNSASSSAYSGIYALASTLSIENSDFSSQTSKETGGFISAIGSSSVTINSTSFSQGYSQKGGAIYIDSSTLLIDSCSFTQNTGYISGGGVYATNTQVTILNSTFNSGLSLLGDAIFMDSQSLTIKNSQFKGSQSVGEISKSSVYVLSSSYIGITNCSFTSPLNVVSALISESSQHVLISDSVFENIVGAPQGAISCTGNNTSGSVQITRTRFISNHSKGNGGALSIEDLSLVMEDCAVQGNSAEVDGGGMMLITPNCKTCYFNITRTNITNNQCNGEGGGIKWEDYRPNIEDTVIIKGNTATYGGNLASSPCSIKPPFARLLSESPDFIIFDAVPGQNYSGVLNISLYDTYGKIVATDYSSILIIGASASYPDLTLKGNTSFTAVQGVFSISSFLPAGLPGSSHQFLASTSSIPSGVANDKSVYSGTAMIEIYLRNCTYGEKYSTTSCIPCPPGSFLIEPDYSCIVCPDGANCPGGNAIFPMPGYWRSTNLSQIIYPCAVAGACLGSTTATDYSGTCSTGYYGVVCNSGIAGYFKT